ncbi:MAG: hypothetical protein ACE5MG_12920 [Candidatus Methylomirabilales bacterium]
MSEEKGATARTEAPSGPHVPKRHEERDEVVIRFAGDSGDGMQLAGMQFTNETAVAGTDIATLPDFPAEIRAPAGTLFGVSGFQINFSSHDIFTPGPRCPGDDEPGGPQDESEGPEGGRHHHRGYGGV